MDPTQHDLFHSVYSRSGRYYTGALRQAFVEAWSRDLSGTQALDLGCGEGRHAIHLAERGSQVMAVDASAAAIRKLSRLATRRALPIYATLEDLEGFSLLPETYDIIVAVTVLGHLDSVTRTRITQSIPQALKPGGRAYVEVFTTDDPGYVLRQGRFACEPVLLASETAAAVRHYYVNGELRQDFAGLAVEAYDEGSELDISHGRPHVHGIAYLMGRKV